MQPLLYHEPNNYNCNGKHYELYQGFHEEIRNVDGRVLRTNRFEDYHRSHYRDYKEELIKEEFLDAIRKGRHSPGEVADRPRCIELYMQIMQVVEQRPDRTRLLIKLNPYNHIATNISKDIIRQHNDILTLAVEDRPHVFRPFYFFDITYEY